MIILSIETSCDETAISIVEATGDFPGATYEVLGDAVLSQIELHREYGGVFPALAKREHARALVPVLEQALTAAKLPTLPHRRLFPEEKEKLKTMLAREEGLADAILSFSERHDAPALDMIAVTHGPGLEPALWVGINFAQALGELWDIPVLGVNHMEGHIFSSLFDGKNIAPIEFPSIALLISGGHTELVLMKEWGSYELVGKTRDDAVGEAFDKVARTLGLPYPGGPEISKQAGLHRARATETGVTFPRPMLTSNDFDFSFSGLKTAVLYHVKDKTIGDGEREEIARAFEDAVTDVLVGKTMKAVEHYDAKTIILGGGVSANKHIRAMFKKVVTDERPDVALYLPEAKLTTDNAVMIALAASSQHAKSTKNPALIADGNLSVSTKRA